MKPVLKEALAHKLLVMADNELVVGHRNSEWTGHAPILEEDIAFANIALDEIGHATIWYQLLAQLIGENPETYPDRLVFHREAAEYRNIQMVELPIGDWAFTIVRQYLLDTAELVLLARLAQSQYRFIAEAAAKIRKEEIYHYRHTHAWLHRLGLGTEESHRRMQHALNQLWPYATQLFEPLPDEGLLVEADFVPDPHQLALAWQKLVYPDLRDANLATPENVKPLEFGPDQHTPHLESLLAEMQEVARLDSKATW